MPPDSTLSCIQIAMGLVPGNPPDWVEIVNEFRSLLDGDAFAPETEELLIRALAFQGRLLLQVSHYLPHSMSPETMLQSLAVQALVSKTGLRHLPELRQLQSATPSSSLASLIRDMIQRQEESNRDAPMP